MTHGEVMAAFERGELTPAQAANLIVEERQRVNARRTVVLTWVTVAVNLAIFVALFMKGGR